MESEDEFLDVFLVEEADPAALQHALNDELPAGFHVHAAATIDFDEPSIDASIASQCYQVALDALPDERREPAFLADRLRSFADADTFALRRRNRHRERTLDAKQFVNDLTLVTPSLLSVDIAMTGLGTLKPHEFIGSLLGLSPHDIKLLRVTKTATSFRPRPAERAAAQPEPERLSTTG